MSYFTIFYYNTRNDFFFFVFDRRSKEGDAHYNNAGRKKGKRKNRSAAERGRPPPPVIIVRRTKISYPKITVHQPRRVEVVSGRQQPVAVITAFYQYNVITDRIMLSSSPSFARFHFVNFFYNNNSKITREVLFSVRFN